ncbi:ABC transporter permease subunit [Alkalimonas collagenimarina]|uniref:ABC transporter permease subunit n=1 Tax=Alkalimonas collagenimarina TaxID=400390 RepID=A0ABT9GWM3_9GAMM|nr:ABC transporter permease subunit [Alkalimonas collagenimarina]MDP4535457.1 ABC transporter permease subunit [Alkalimonas collagenimarina]
MMLSSFTGRQWIDRIARWCVSAVGYSVMLALAMIFIFLLLQVAPLFSKASITPLAKEDTVASSFRLLGSVVDDAENSTRQAQHALKLHRPVDFVLSTADTLFLLERDGRYRWLSHQGTDSRRLLSSGQLDIAEITAATMSPTGQTLLVASVDGRIHPYTLLHQELIAMQPIATSGTQIQQLLVQASTRSVVSLDDSDTIRLFHIASGRELAHYHWDKHPNSLMQLSEDEQYLQLTAGTMRQVVKLHNPHPEASWRQLVRPVHYEGRRSADYVWQSSTVSDNTEAKLSLVPLTIGTLKAAWYAMLFATPLAIFAAAYTAFFAPVSWRYRIKAVMEVLESLPTVILGFLAAFLLAPWLELHLLLFLGSLIIVPVTIMLGSCGWFYWRKKQQYGTDQPSWWLVLLSLLTGVVLTTMLVSNAETYLFHGDFLSWLANRGIDYQQRNSLIIGIAMGIAVIPTIFSLTDEAIYHVPTSLTQGVIALGASRWQALSTLILPVAAPGILAACLLGLGRALGETMILLMATGNTPLLGFDPFQGMRTLTATLAIEAPEASLESAHFRVLVLAALLLMILTFVVNTLVTLLRQRLRHRYLQL